MGCTASKQAGRKRAAARESWYAPLSRTVSAPIHYPAESEEDSCHVVSLTSSSYGIIKMGKVGEQADTGSFVRILQDKLALVKDNHETVEDNHAFGHESHEDFAFSRSQVKYKMKLNPVEEAPESEGGDLETLNTWELMEGLHEDGGRTPSPLRTPGKCCVVERSLSFNTVHELDSCFAEIGSPVWKKCFSKEEEEMVKGQTSAQRKLGFGHQSSLSFSGEEEHFDNEFSGYSEIKSPLNSPLKSPTRSPLKSPIRSPLKSPMMGSSSPLFDPTLMATFEQALQAVALPQDDWMLMNGNNEGSTTNSSSLSGNHTWVLSETSSDADSPQSELMATPKEKPPHVLLMKKEKSSKVSPWNRELKMGRLSYDLESFEPRCPPGGEEKVVLYFTSLRGVRRTYEECCDLRLIFQGLGVYVDERDVWMHSKFREELTELLDNKRLQVPRLFIKGRYIGGAEDVRHLHEDGVLIRLIGDLPCFGLFRKVCKGCADVRFIPCLTCSGSCKVLDELDQVVRCSKCNENGLIMCPLCS